MSALLEPVRDATPRRVRLGFVGLGWIGRMRLDALAADPGIEVAALCDGDATRLQAAGQVYANARPSTDVGELLDADLDGVVIATPNGCHAEQAIAALERGHAVFCQKPLAVDAAQAARIVSAAERADRLLEVDYCYRHVAGMSDLRRRVHAGELGDLLGIELVFHNAFGPDKGWCYDRRLAGGGCVLDLGVHLLDLAVWLRGGAGAATPHALELVSAERYSRGRALPAASDAIEDLAFATWRDPEGATVRLACSWNAQLGCDALIGLRLFGSAGGAVWRNVAGSFYDFELQLAHGPRTQVLASGPDDWGARALRAWVDRLRAGARFDPAAHEYVAGARLVDAVYAA